MKVIAPGLMVMAIIYFMGAVSGPFKSGGHLRVRGAAQFSLESGAGVYRGADHLGHRRGVFPPGDVRRDRIARRHYTRSGRERF
jgi:hypothetical protein